jgi:formylglycine-generating enzyme required for sulfatase activity
MSWAERYSRRSKRRAWITSSGLDWCNRATALCLVSRSLLLIAVLVAGSCKRKERGSTHKEAAEIDRHLPGMRQISDAGRSKKRKAAGSLMPAPRAKPRPDLDNMAFVPGGCFTMSDMKNEGMCYGRCPLMDRHKACVSSFYIDRYEITVDQFARCVADGKCTKPDRYDQSDSLHERDRCNWGRKGFGRHPVNCVTWKHARDYCAWLGKRLPTSAEWERAARGDDGRLYPWGNEPPTCERAIMSQGTDKRGKAIKPGCGKGHTWPVGSKPKGVSPYGVHDLSGNVYEWVRDWYQVDWPNPVQDPKGPPGPPDRSPMKVVRGGAYDMGPGEQRAAGTGGAYFGDSFMPPSSDPSLGFRCAVSASTVGGPPRMRPTMRPNRDASAGGQRADASVASGQDSAVSKPGKGAADQKGSRPASSGNAESHPRPRQQTKRSAAPKNRASSEKHPARIRN